MRSGVAHIVATVAISLLFVGVSSLPTQLKLSQLTAEEAVHHIQRRAPGLPPPKMNVTKPCNSSVDNSTKCDADFGIFHKISNMVRNNADTMYRALLVLGSISLIVIVYISLRYFW